LLQESESDGTLVRQYLYTDLGELLGFVDGNSQLYFVHNDHLSTPLYLTDSSGNVVWRAERKPFGEIEGVRVIEIEGVRVIDILSLAVYTPSVQQ